jgi:nitrate reductase gamma subunit
MNHSAGSFVFGVWPYLAAIVAAAGLAIRLLATADRLPAVKRVLPRAQRIYLGGWLWRACWALLAGAHLVGLLFPRAILSLTRTAAGLMAIEAIGFAIGLAVFAACVRTVWLHVGRPGRRGWSLFFDLTDATFMSMLIVGAASGLVAAGLHRWGSAWGSVAVAPYAASLVHGRPAPAFVEHLPLMVRLHLFTAFAALAVFPTTRLAAFPILFVHRALGVAGRAVTAAARPAAAAFRRGPAVWLWPDHEIRWVAKPRTDVARKPLTERPSVLWPRPAHEGGVVGTVKHGNKAV